MDSTSRSVFASKTDQEVYSYYNLATDLYEYGWGASFHFCRYAYGEGFYQAMARHEHYLAHVMGLRDGMKVLDVGCGVGGPAREIIKFANVNIVGLNNNDYQIERATRYAAKEGLSHQLSFTKGDFMVSLPRNLPMRIIIKTDGSYLNSKCPFLPTVSTPSMPSKPPSTPPPSKVSTPKYSAS